MEFFSPNESRLGNLSQYCLEFLSTDGSAKAKGADAGDADVRQGVEQAHVGENSGPNSQGGTSGNHQH